MEIGKEFEQVNQVPTGQGVDQSLARLNLPTLQNLTPAENPLGKGILSCELIF